MNDRHDDEQSDADWLASQFGATGGVPTPKKPEKPEEPEAPAPVADPPTLVNPFGAPGAMPPPAGTGSAYPPPVVPPAAQPPAFPPAAPPPAFPPAAQPPVAPTPPAEPTASPFPWELAPGGDPSAAQPTPTAPQQPGETQPPLVVPPVIPPAAAPPVTPPPASTVPPAFPWEAAAAGAAAHEPAPLDPSFDGAPQFAAEPPPEPMPWETARLPEVAPEAADAPAFQEPAPTQAMDQSSWADPAPTQLILPPTESFGAAAAATELLGASPDPANAPSSALDALFGEERFREYEAGTDESEGPVTRRTKEPDAGGKPDGVGTTQKVLLWIAGGLVAAIALVALFLVGTRLPDLLGPAPIVSHSSSPSPSPSPTVIAVGPLAPGTYAWDELLGGECLDPFESPWSEEFTVVDCTVPHPAQMVFRGEFVLPDPTNEAYPGEEALTSQLALLCSAPGVVDLAAAGAYPDVQFQGSFPATEEQWDAGDRYYFCFVSRASGEPLTASVAVPQAPPAA